MADFFIFVASQAFRSWKTAKFLHQNFDHFSPYLSPIFFHCGLKNPYEDMRFFLLARSWVVLSARKKKLSKNWQIIGVFLKMLHFRYFWGKKFMKSRSGTYIAPRNPTNFFSWFESPIRVESRTTFKTWGTWRNIGHLGA